MATDEGLRLRLEALNRGALPAGARVEVAKSGVVPRLEPAVRKLNQSAPRTPAEATSPNGAAWRSGVVKPLPGLVRRGEAAATEAGEHLRIVVPVEEIWPGGEQLVARRCEALRAAPIAKGETACWQSRLPEGALFLDLETCGLSGSALFLVGMLRPVDGRLAVELLLARDYSEEAAVLASFWQLLAGVTTIVTFNGKSFDWPMVVDRSRRHRLSVPRVSFVGVKKSGRPGTHALPHPSPLPGGEGTEGIAHVDLLHLSRRRWRSELPDCKLQTLERHVCGRLRTDDMPSSQIPAAYQQFVRTKFEREMDAVLMHNAIDLVTMLDLAMRLA
jgi:hypothetical protein